MDGETVWGYRMEEAQAIAAGMLAVTSLCFLLSAWISREMARDNIEERMERPGGNEPPGLFD